MTVLHADDVLPAGKYVGKTVAEAFSIDKHYVRHFNNAHASRSGFRDRYSISDDTIDQLTKDEVNRVLSIKSGRIL